jgi:hypothetical protein
MPSLWEPNDEFADFELHYKRLIGTNPAVTSRVGYGFIRQALVNGLKHEIELGVNPFEFGIVFGADSHSAFSINEEFNFTGPHGVSDATPKARLSKGAVSTGAPAIDLASAGTTAVWTPENTREAIFDAIKNKEIDHLLFVLVIVLLERSFRILEIRWPRWAEALPAYTVGGLGEFWTIQRVAIMVGGFVK